MSDPLMYDIVIEPVSADLTFIALNTFIC